MNVVWMEKWSYYPRGRQWSVSSVNLWNYFRNEIPMHQKDCLRRHLIRFVSNMLQHCVKCMKTSSWSFALSVRHKYHIPVYALSGRDQKHKISCIISGFSWLGQIGIPVVISVCCLGKIFFHKYDTSFLHWKLCTSLTKQSNLLI